MPVWFCYVDESYNTEKYCLSALMIRHSEWKACFDEIRSHRGQLKNDHGLFISKEIHAQELVSGHGRISTQTIGKWQRSRIFYGLLQLTARLPEVKLFNVCLPAQGGADLQLTCWDRLVNRIERTMQEFDNREIRQRGKVLDALRGKVSQKDLEYIERRLKRYRSRAFILADEGREREITKALRRMRVHNFIPSRFGAWEPGKQAKNIVTDRIIEDPVFKESHRSYFLQLADCAAFALLKRESRPTPLVQKYGLHKMWDETLAAICYREASPRDPFGIVRK
jgi:Protein of unknown function (DUF3800)